MPPYFIVRLIDGRPVGDVVKDNGEAMGTIAAKGLAIILHLCMNVLCDVQQYIHFTIIAAMDDTM